MFKVHVSIVVYLSIMFTETQLYQTATVLGMVLLVCFEIVGHKTVVSIIGHRHGDHIPSRCSRLGCGRLDLGFVLVVV